MDVTSSQPDEKSLRLTLHNFDNTIGATGYWAEVGTMSGKPLFLDLFVEVVGSGEKGRVW